MLSSVSLSDGEEGVRHNSRIMTAIPKCADTENVFVGDLVFTCLFIYCSVVEDDEAVCKVRRGPRGSPLLDQAVSCFFFLHFYRLSVETIEKC